MTKKITLIILIIGLGIYSSAQPVRVKYLDLNLFPLIGKTLEFGYIEDFRKNLSLSLKQ